MSGSFAGVAESIRVYHKPFPHKPDVHVLDIEWTDPTCQVHTRRVVCSDDQLRTRYRPAYLAGETIPGVGQLLLDCPVLKDEEPHFGARLLLGVHDVIDIPVLEVADE